MAPAAEGIRWEGQATTTAWSISDTATSASIIQRTSLPRELSTSTASRVSWGLTKVRLAKFKGLPNHTFHLHLKETEWRYNQRRSDKYKTLLTYLRQNPIS